MNQDLIEQFGENPYEFIWILRTDDANPNLNLEQQRLLWTESLKKYPIEGVNPCAHSLWAITDNGDLIMEETNTTNIVVDSRAGEVLRFHMTKAELIANYVQLFPDVFGS